MTQSLGPVAVVGDLLRVGLAGDPDRIALISAETRWSWRLVDRLSGRLAHGLLRLGLKPGDRVASLMPNCPALVVHHLACLKAGLVATPLNYRYMAPEVGHALSVSGARAVCARRARPGPRGEQAGRPTAAGPQQLRGVGPGRSRVRRADRGGTPVRATGGEPPIGAGGDLLHLGQHRTAEGGHPHP
jgi:non-ribosomal peptide synthetase component E (peptide arylation enzyme)